MKLAKVNEQLALRNRRSKILGEIALVIGLLIFVWGIAGGAFAVINYEGVIKVVIGMVIATAGGWKCFRMRK